jgi:2-keto-4-pentenoate hydratase
MSGTDARSRAHALYEARRTRKPIPPFTDDNPSLGMADGYAIQQELVAMLLAGGDRIVGYKVGLTSAPMQRMFGIDAPDYGPVLASTMYANADTISLDRFIAPKVEAEIVFRLGSRLAGPDVSRDHARAAISDVHPRVLRRRAYCVAAAEAHPDQTDAARIDLRV